MGRLGYSFWVVCLLFGCGTEDQSSRTDSGFDTGVDGAPVGHDAVVLDAAVQDAAPVVWLDATPDVDALAFDAAAAPDTAVSYIGPLSLTYSGAPLSCVKADQIELEFIARGADLPEITVLIDDQIRFRRTLDPDPESRVRFDVDIADLDDGDYTINVYAAYEEQFVIELLSLTVDRDGPTLEPPDPDLCGASWLDFAPIVTDSTDPRPMVHIETRWLSPRLRRAEISASDRCGNRAEAQFDVEFETDDWRPELFGPDGVSLPELVYDWRPAPGQAVPMEMTVTGGRVDELAVVLEGGSITFDEPGEYVVTLRTNVCGRDRVSVRTATVVGDEFVSPRCQALSLRGAAPEEVPLEVARLADGFNEILADLHQSLSERRFPPQNALNALGELARAWAADEAPVTLILAALEVIVWGRSVADSDEIIYCVRQAIAFQYDRLKHVNDALCGQRGRRGWIERSRWGALDRAGTVGMWRASVCPLLSQPACNMPEVGPIASEGACPPQPLCVDGDLGEAQSLSKQRLLLERLANRNHTSPPALQVAHAALSYLDDGRLGFTYVQLMLAWEALNGQAQIDPDGVDPTHWAECVSRLNVFLGEFTLNGLGRCSNDAAVAAIETITRLGARPLGGVFPASEWRASMCTVLDAWRCLPFGLERPRWCR